MGHLFQVECWEKRPRGCPFALLWLRKLEKVVAKALKWGKSILGTFIYENNGN